MILSCSKSHCSSLCFPIWCLIAGCMIEFSTSLSFGAGGGGRPAGIASTLTTTTTTTTTTSSSCLDHGVHTTCNRQTIINSRRCRKLSTALLMSPKMTHTRTQQTRNSISLYSNLRTQQEEAVDRLMQNVEVLNNGEDLDESSASKIEEAIKCTVDEMDKIYATCNDNYSNDDDENIGRFEPALGLYDVSHVQTARKGDNPVGGKWTRKNKLAQQLFSTRRTFQHLIPTNSTGLGRLHTRARRPVVAECINVISLDAFFKLLRLNVILRGDAIPLTMEERTSPKLVGKLSNLAVRAFFDPPRIILGKGTWLNLELGPNTSVVLDTTYVDDSVRIGKGGTSGTKFIFFRCGESDDEEEEAMEFKALLQTRKMRTSKVLAVIGAFGASGVGVSLWRGSRVAAGLIGAITTLAALGISSSTGGVEDDGLDGDVLGDSDDNEKLDKNSIS